MSLHWEEAKVIVTCGGAKDLEDVPKDLLQRITVHPVKHYDEILDFAFETPEEKQE